MQVNWKKLLITASIWLASETVLNLVGLDSLADYTEFIFRNDCIVVQVLPVSYTSF